ncbi:MAG: hypothetical protein ACLSF2_11150 [Butyricicoccus sp.]
MMEKKRMAALLAAVLFGMSAIPAGAVNLIDTDTAATDSAEHAELDLYGVRATVTDRQDGALTVSTETAGTVVVAHYGADDHHGHADRSAGRRTGYQKG